MEDTENSIDPEKLHLNKSPVETNQETLAESIRLLQEHGITMLPHDDSNILTTVMETGHSVVLTDAGKQVLNAFKESEQKTNKKILTVTPEEFLSITSSNQTNSKNVIKQINDRLVPKSIKRIVMRKNKMVPVSNVVNNLYKINNTNVTDMETVMTQLIEARKTIEEYKIKLFKKEQEAERYKQQLKLLLDDS